jgi:anaerobic dimethyl sulfoxide reductase subunit B (iron-sulfur subunit)
MTRQLAFHFDQRHCTGCRTCQIACKDKNDLEVGQQFRKVIEIEGGDFQQKGPAVEPKIYAFCISVSCNHCIDPACVKSCPVGAMRKRPEDGIVVIDSKSCIGCRRCIKACPYDAIQYDPTAGKVSKCDFCLDELETGRKPVCVAACPMRALDFGQLDDLQQKYGTCGHTFGMPEASITQPALVITPHPDALGRSKSK